MVRTVKIFFKSLTVIFFFWTWNAMRIYVLYCHARTAMAKEGEHAAQAHAAGYSNGGRYCHCWALEFGSITSLRVSAAGAGSKLMLASSRPVEFSAGSLFGFTHCASCSNCLHSSQPSAKGGIRKNKICITYTTCLAHILKHITVEC